MTQKKNQNSSGLASDRGQKECSLVQRFIDSEDGTTAIEYALIAGGLSIVIITSVQLLGVNLTSLFTAVQSGF